MVLKGTLLFKLKDSEKYASTGENLFIGKAQAYSIKNTGFIPAELIEVRVGEYLGEDDQVLIDSKAL